MATPTFSAAQFQRAILSLMPTGPIWRREPDSILSKISFLLALVYERNTARAADCLRDVFPGTTLATLPEWEKSLGLPDACTGPLTDVSQRRALVLTRLTDQGGSSIAYYVALAARNGFAITIEEFKPARVGMLHAGDAIQGEAWAQAWRVHAPENSILRFRVGENTAGEPLAVWGNKVLECIIRCRAPAHTILSFSYDK